MNIRELKKPIRAFFQHYTDERLAQLLCHARDGKLNFTSCCCFIGVATADHALQTGIHQESVHYWRAKNLVGASDAECAFKKISYFNDVRRRLLIPMIRAEMKRRARQHEAQSDRVEEERRRIEMGNMSEAMRLGLVRR